MAKKIRSRKQNKDGLKDAMLDLERKSHREATECYKEVEGAIDDAMRSLDGEITKWLTRIARNNHCSIEEARKLLKGAELEEFKWTVEEYIQRGEENALTQAWLKELENASARAHISRLESLQLKIRQHFFEAYGVELNILRRGLTELYTDQNLRGAYEFQKFIGIGYSFVMPDTRKIDKVITRPWSVDGIGIDNRIYQYADRAAETLRGEITRMVLTGEAPDKAITRMTEFVRGNVGNMKRAAGRLVMTEYARVRSEANQDCYKQLDVEQYQILATLDRETCRTCGSLDENHFPMSEYEVGKTAPPYHPWCRCSTAPWYDNGFEHVGERAYRDENGKTQYCSDMSYEEWKKRYPKASGYVEPEEGTGYTPDPSLAKQDQPAAPSQPLPPDDTQAPEVPLNPLPTPPDAPGDTPIPPKDEAPAPKKEPKVWQEHEMESEAAKYCLQNLKDANIERRPFRVLEKPLTGQKLIDFVGGHDDTTGSCVSLSIAYAVSKGGAKVSDFRGGASADVFSDCVFLDSLYSIPGVDSRMLNYTDEIRGANALLSKMKKGKEYILSCGEHAAVVRLNKDGQKEYLELQECAWSNGWKPLTSKVLRRRFNARRDGLDEDGIFYANREYLVDIDSLKDNPDVWELACYLNTSKADLAKARKEAYGGPR